MPHRSDTSDTHTSGWDSILGGGFTWAGLLIFLFLLKLVEVSL